MKLSMDLSRGILTVEGREIQVWSEVRNEINGRRPRAGSPDLCFSILHDGRFGPPTMPRPFPVGSWRVTGIIPHLSLNAQGQPAEPYLFPFFIATDAWQDLDEWSLDAQGYYAEKTGRKVRDYAFGLHFSSSRTTTGCARIALEKDLRWLVDWIHPRLADGERIDIDVV